MAKNKFKNTLVEMEMEDGSKVKLTLSYGRLIQLSSKNRRAYDEYNKVFNKREGTFEEIDNLRILYAAYLCAQIQLDMFEDAMKWEEFVENTSQDRTEVGRAIKELMSPKDHGDTARPSE